MNDFRRTCLEPALYLRFAGGMPSLLGVVQYSYDIRDMRPGRSLDKTPGKTPVGKALGKECLLSGITLSSWVARAFAVQALGLRRYCARMLQ